MMRVYPRVCGGTNSGIWSNATTQGLSPRVRGNRHDGSDTVRGERSIPACAGEPAATTSTLGSTGVYPRVCGGTRRITGTERVIEGLSPRVRGNPYLPSGRPPRRRSIPACAGEPACAPPRQHRGAVYPRVCGGTANGIRDTEIAGGLSPRVRGNPRGARRQDAGRRSIPACAGEPRAAFRRSPSPMVYPRVCGGTHVSARPETKSVGLSPRVRGNRGRRRRWSGATGSIPACAGEPRRHRPPGWSAWVYPRVCGGTDLPIAPLQRYAGLSPRVRGNRSLSTGAENAGRSIPACAGEPRGMVSQDVRREVYPRVCGGT